MGLLVQKFGGTSVGDLERIRHVADIVVKARLQGHQVVVVVSAMNHTTDELIRLATGLAPEPPSREWDVLLATGEQVSAALLSIALHAQGYPAVSYNAWQLPIKTTAMHRKAEIIDIDLTRLSLSLQQGIIPVVTGFQGMNAHGDITTIGRGGSDTSAVMLAAKLSADECQIYTDVDGVFTSDPRVVKQAKCLTEITSDEMLEFANLGAEVLQKTAIQLAEYHQVPLRVLSSFNDKPGTLITSAAHLKEGEHSWVSGIVCDRNQVQLTIRALNIQHSHHAEQALENLWIALQQAAISVDMLVYPLFVDGQAVNISFTIALEDYSQALLLAREWVSRLEGGVVMDNDRIAKLSLVGVGMKTHASAATKMLHALGEEGIEIQLITSSETRISAILDEKYMELGARVLHTAFGLD